MHTGAVLGALLGAEAGAAALAPELSAGLVNKGEIGAEICRRGLAPCGEATAPELAHFVG